MGKGQLIMNGNYQVEHEIIVEGARLVLEALGKA